MNLNDLIQDLQKLNTDIEQEITKALPKIGETLKFKIIKRVQEGDGVDELGGSRVPFKALKSSTIKSRQKKQAKGKLSNNTKPDKSNQTETGHMVEDMQVSTNGMKINISPPNDRVEVAQYNEKNGRVAFNISEDELVYITEEVAKAIEQALKKNL
jgi:hypothetical protein